MHCPLCNYADTRVVYTRPIEKTDAIERRRECLRCNNRFTTSENSNKAKGLVNEPSSHAKERAGSRSAI